MAITVMAVMAMAKVMEKDIISTTIISHVHGGSVLLLVRKRKRNYGMELGIWNKEFGHLTLNFSCRLYWLKYQIAPNIAVFELLSPNSKSQIPGSLYQIIKLL